MQGNPTSAGRLRAPTLIAYASPALPLAALQLPLFVLLPSFYAENLGLGLAAVGGVLLAARLFDMATDPLIGWLSDHWRTRYGRRRPWLVLGTPLLMLAAWQVMAPPDAPGLGYLLIWMLVLSLATTMLLMPHQAWAAELSPDYHERSRINGYREAATVIGTLAALVLPVLWGGDQRQQLLILALFIIALMPVLVALAVTRTPDRIVSEGMRLPPREAWRALAANAPFRQLVVSYLLNGIANGLPATLFVLYVTNVLALDYEKGVGPLLLLYFFAAIAAVPLWIWLSKNLGKLKAWLLSMGLASIGFAPAAFLGEGDVILFGIICVVTGIALGGEQILPPAIQADVVDYDTLKSGRRRAGLYFALWGMVTKLALAVSAGLAFPLLEVAGFNKDSGDGLFALALLYGALPIAFKLAAIALLRGFPIDARRQAEIRQAIEQREARGPEGSYEAAMS